MHITLIAGARPNFMKIAPIIRAIERERAAGKNIDYCLVHTGQHYDKNMSARFFEELNIPEPDANLGSGGGTQAEQTAAIMVGFERYLREHPTDIVIVVGDVNSTLACSIVARKAGVQVAHVEGGLRSGDWSMPEEINRIVTDSISNYFFTTSQNANENLIKEGVEEERIFLVGNTMIDTLLHNLPRLKKPNIWDSSSLGEKEYLVLTLHRPANVDDPCVLKSYLDEIMTNSRGLPVVFPVHPRTRKVLNELNIAYPNLKQVEPLGYLEFIYLVKHSLAVLTDSGGITEETSVLKVPCMTLRDNTERPETVTLGTNELIGTNPDNIRPAMERLFSGNWKKGGELPFWDGKAAERIVGQLCAIFKV